MKKSNISLKKAVSKIRVNIMVSVIFIAVSVTGLLVLRAALLKNAEYTGTALAQTYAWEEQSHITVYENLITLGSLYLEERLQSDFTQEQMQNWINIYFNSVKEFLDSDIADPYMVVGQKIYGANQWEGDEGYDFSSSEWYIKAVEADGEIVFTDAYTDAVTGKAVLTIAKKCSGSDAVLAFDIFPENLHSDSDMNGLPEDSSYFLCDAKGNLLFTNIDPDVSYNELQEYVDSLSEGWRDGSLRPYDSFITDMEGEKRGVYFVNLDNGWSSVVTIPFGVTLKQFDRLIIVFCLAFALFFLYTIIYAYRDYQNNKLAVRADETVRVLGNTYYALYRVNYEEGTYEMIKGSDYVRDRIPKKGPYEDLIRTVEEITYEKTSKEFSEKFSRGNIKKLVSKRIRDFGGDFLRRFGEDYRWVNVRMLYDESLDNGEVVLCFREVGEEKEAQLKQRQLLENSLEAAKKSEISKNKFFSNMSHDMRTPLNAVIGLTELAQRSIDDPKKVSECMKKINTSGKHLLNLINDILEISRLEQGKLSFNNSKFDLEEAVNECTSVFAHQAEEENKKFSVKCELQNPIVWGDRFRISQVLNNLLSNALKYSSEGDSVWVDVKEFGYNGHFKYQIKVRDTGIGMSDEFVSKIFQPYARENSFGAKNINGTGLGMSIVKSLVTQMSGEITVESSLGKGSTFTVTIPLEADCDQKMPDKPAETTPSGKDNKDDLAGLKVILAEDNEINMEIAFELLSLKGIEVAKSRNGIEAVEKFAASDLYEYDAILMDMQMPELDGCQAAERIRGMDREDAKKIPIIAVTANAFAEDIARTSKSGMNAHISKPIDFPELYKLLGKLTGRYSDS